LPELRCDRFQTPSVCILATVSEQYPDRKLQNVERHLNREGVSDPQVLSKHVFLIHLPIADLQISIDSSVLANADGWQTEVKSTCDGRGGVKPSSRRRIANTASKITSTTRLLRLQHNRFERPIYAAPVSVSSHNGFASVI
jgi:hypothetical protein